MSREKKSYLCEGCGAISFAWRGRCSECGAWNSLVEQITISGTPRPVAATLVQKPVPLSAITADVEIRSSTGIMELDRVLGGGLVAGSVILLGGDPGIGKSTLLLQTSANLAKTKSVLYASGEESVRQIKMRADRLGINSDQMLIYPENRLESLLRAITQYAPHVLVVDSIQTLATDRLDSAAGTVSQIRECAGKLLQVAKEMGIPTFFVGHVTKDGALAGPKVMEHMVDAVLYFEGERGHQYRILRAVKNRFGPANEIGVFEMRETGMHEVSNPSAFFLAERNDQAPGSVVFAGIEGTRPLLVEIQALVVPSPLAMPRRTTLGLDGGRLGMLTAILERRLGIGFFDRDIFLNVAGGLKIAEPAADLAIAAAILSSHLNRAVHPQMVIIGEIGLLGEVRSVAHVAMRLKEAAKLGFTHALLPNNCLETLPNELSLCTIPIASIEELAQQIV